MTEDIAKKRKLSEECLSFSNEVLTDIFSFLSRKILTKNIEPVNKYFFNICKENVKSIHLIKCSSSFAATLACDQKNEKVKQHYVDLISSKCSLNEHFAIGGIWQVIVSHGEEDKDIREAPLKYIFVRSHQFSTSVILHSLDLFRNGWIRVSPFYVNHICTSEYLREILFYLNIFDSINIAQIELVLPECNVQLPNHLQYSIAQRFLINPAILNCQRLKIKKFRENEPHFTLLVNWLHYKTKNNNCDYRLLIIIQKREAILEDLDELIDKCKENFDQSESPINQRSYIFGFISTKNVTEFTLENTKSEELIFLENLKSKEGEKTNYYLLRRCNKIKENNQKEYCQKLFKNSFLEFKIYEHVLFGKPCISIC